MDSSTPMEALNSASLGVLGSLLKELDELRSTEEWARQLTEDLVRIKTKLEKLSKVHDLPHTVSCWMKDARELSYDMEEFLDDFIHAISIDAETERVNKLISGFKNRTDELIERYNRYNLEYFLRQTTNTLPIHRLPVVHEWEPPSVILDGINGPANKILRWLKPKGDDDREMELQVVSIHGVEGVGKSTLAQKLWRELEGDFECRAFVQTNKKPDTRMLLTNILSQVRLERPPENFLVPDLIQDIRKHLQNERYFIVIDDIWTLSVWDVLSRAFPDSNCCSRIVITTRSENIALACSSYDPEYTFRMEPLGKDDSRTLFISRAFGSENGCHPENNSLDEIIRKCGGLPLALICLAAVVASLPKKEQQLEYMKFVCNNLRTISTAMDVLNQVLKICYDSLPQSLKTCLLYLSIYPPSYTIPKEDLVKQWIAEGFICALDEKDIEEIARNYFDELISLNLIQPMDISNRDKKKVTYRVHPVVYHFVTSNSMNDNFITIIDYTPTTVVFNDKIRRLALHFGSATYATAPANTGLKQVRSFAYMGLVSCMPSLEDFKLVRVMILHFHGEHEVTTFSLTEIKDMVLLRYLNVRCGFTVTLPDQVQCLKQLETLDVNAVVAAVPSDIVDHPSLKHVRLGTKMKHYHLIMCPDTSGEGVLLNSSDRISSIFLQKLELLPPICIFSRLPQWAGQLKELRVLEIVVRELGMYEPEFLILSGLPFLTALSLHVRKPNARRVFNFPGAALPVLKYLKLVCGVLLLSFQKEAVCNLEKLKIGFNIHSEVDYGKMLSGIDNLLNLRVIVASIGAVEESSRAAAESALRDLFPNRPKIQGENPSLKVKRVEPFYEEQDPLPICSPTDQKNESEIQEEESSIEQPEVLQKLPTEDSTHNPASVPPDVEGLAAGPSSGAAYQGPQQFTIGIRWGPTDETEIELARLNEIICSLQVKLKGLLELDHALPSNVRKDIRLICHNLDGMRHFIREYSVFCPRGYMERRFKGWFNRFRELAFDIEDFVDLWTITSKNEGLLTRIRRSFKTTSRPDEILTNLRDIKRRVAEQCERLPRDFLAEPSRDPFIGRFHHQSMAKLVGMARPVRKVINMLFEAGETAERKIIFIVGMAGSGKTTLAAEVYRELVSQDYFQRSAFVSAGQKPEMDSETLKDMLLQLDNKHQGHDSDEYDDRNFHEERVRELLRNSRYLIVIDDLRMGFWDILLNCTKEDNLGSRIIITTNNPELMKHKFLFPSYCVYKMDLLSDTDSKSLFLKIVFGNEQGCPNHLEAISSQIIKRCGGLPLALISIASSLKFSPPTQEEWERHVLNFLSSSDGKYMMQILSSSYDNLPSRSKTCMLYLSIFPEQYEVEVERLMRLWIAEGFIIREPDLLFSRRTTDLKAGKTARSIVKELISRNIVQPLHVKHNGIPRYFRVHPVMHDFIVYKSIKENLVTLVDGQRQYAPANNSTIRRLSHQSSSNGDQEGSQIASADLSHARTIIVFGQASAVPPLTNLRLVRVLDLDGCRGPVCLDGLHNLLLLRYLSLRGTDVCELPDNIGVLRCLETLDVRSTNVNELPACILRLENLKHLLAGSAKLPQGISKMKTLQTLSGSIATNSYTEMKKLSKLAYLRELDLSCDLTEVPEDGKHFEFPVDGFQSLRLLCIQGTLPSVTFGRDVLPRVETLELKFKRCISGDILGVENLRSLTHVLLEFPQYDAGAMAIADTVREAASRPRLNRPVVTVLVDGRTLDPLPQKEKKSSPLH